MVPGEAGQNKSQIELDQIWIVSSMVQSDFQQRVALLWWTFWYMNVCWSEKAGDIIRLVRNRMPIIWEYGSREWERVAVETI